MSTGRHRARRFVLLQTLLFAAVFLVSLVAALAAAQPAGSVILVNFDVPVDAGSSALMHRVVDMAIRDHAKAILIEMNTPGGLLSDMLSIVGSITQANQSGIPTYTYVPPGGLAASAGSYIAMSTNKIYMAAGTEIGPSTPIVEGGTALEQNHTEDAMIKYMVGLASAWGRNTTAAYYMVEADEAFSAQQAVSNHIITGISNSLNQTLSDLGLTSYPIYTVSENLYEQFLSVLSNTDVDGLLILLGELAILIDLYHPTIIISIVGAIAILAGLVGLEVIGASILGYFLLALAAALILIELKLGHGFAMVGGVAIGAAGIFLLGENLRYSTSSPVLLYNELIAVGAVAVGILAAFYIRSVAAPIRNRKKLTGRESMIGKQAVVTSDLTPRGEVRAEGVVWSAVSADGSTIPKGTYVSIKRVDGIVLVVAREQNQQK